MTSPYRLNDPLPSDVASGGDTVFTRYRQYPVFSWPWLIGRSKLFSVILGLFALLMFVGFLTLTGNVVMALQMGALQFFGFMVIAMAAPCLVTWVRHRRWSDIKERRAVVIAWLVGILIAYLCDSFASAKVNEFLGEYSSEARAALEAQAEMSQLEPWRKIVAGLSNLLVGFLIYGLLGGGIALRGYFGERRRWEARQHQEEVALLAQQKRNLDRRLSVLQAQVEPHFLFNTLASVRALVRRDAERAEATLDALVVHLRSSIPKLRSDAEAPDSRLGQQLDLCQSYLEVMRLRTADRLSYEVVAEDILRECLFPPLLLITLVENAIKHGVEPKPGPCHVRVKAWRDEAQLHVSVSDNGAGFSPGVSTGMGLVNVREQLRAIYGDKAHFHISSVMTGGVNAQIDLPYEVEASK